MTCGGAPIVIVGAGASGLMAAIHASGRGRATLLVEGTKDGGRKILISGGGRCNILPSVPAPERFVTDSSPNTLRNILRGWPLSDQRGFFEEALGLTLVLEPETGKLFPRETARGRSAMPWWRWPAPGAPSCDSARGSGR